MKIKMIGTGAISVKERSACCLIDERILVDCGNGIVKTLLEHNVNTNKIDTLLITHLHGDHFLDIPFLITTYKPLQFVSCFQMERFRRLFAKNMPNFHSVPPTFSSKK